MDTITDYNEDDPEDDAKTGEKHTHEEADDKHGDHSRSKPAGDTNYARHIKRSWLDVHNIIPRTDPGLFIPGIPRDYCDVEEDFVIGTKRSHPGDDEGDRVPRKCAASPRSNNLHEMAIVKAIPTRSKVADLILYWLISLLNNLDRTSVSGVISQSCSRSGVTARMDRILQMERR